MVFIWVIIRFFIIIRGLWYVLINEVIINLRNNVISS